MLYRLALHAVIQQRILVRELSVLTVLLLSHAHCSQGLLAGRLDQRQRLLRVQSVMARDVRPEDIGNMIQKLSQW